MFKEELFGQSIVYKIIGLEPSFSIKVSYHNSNIIEFHARFSKCSKNRFLLTDLMYFGFIKSFLFFNLSTISPETAFNPIFNQR